MKDQVYLDNIARLETYKIERARKIQEMLESENPYEQAHMLVLYPELMRLS